MPIRTVFAGVSCSNIEVSTAWYEKLFGLPPVRIPTTTLAEWQFSDSAEVQLLENADEAGASTLTLGVLPMNPEVERMKAAGLDVGEVESVEDYFVMRMRDPDGNLVVFASARRT